MRSRLIFLGLLAAIFLVLPAFSGQGQTPSNNAQATGKAPAARTDEQDVRKASAAHLEAVNKGDLNAVMAYWAPDADYVDETGKKTSGHDALVALFKTTLANLKGFKVGGKVYGVKFLRPDVALVD